MQRSFNKIWLTADSNKSIHGRYDHNILVCDWLLKGLEKLILWARMNFNVAKSKSLVLKKGKTSERDRFKLSGEFIPTIKQNPIKNLGKRFDNTMKDSVAIQETKGILEVWLDKVDKSGLPSRRQAFIIMLFFPRYCGRCPSTISLLLP